MIVVLGYLLIQGDELLPMKSRLGRTSYIYCLKAKYHSCKVFAHLTRVKADLSVCKFTFKTQVCIKFKLCFMVFRQQNHVDSQL